MALMQTLIIGTVLQQSEMAHNVPSAMFDGGDVVEDADEYMANHPLTTLFGDTARVRILVALLEAGEPLNPSRIAEHAGLEAESTWYRNKDELLDAGIIVQSGSAGNSPLYRIAGGDGLPDGDDRVQCLEKLADWTARALRDTDDDSDTDDG